MVSIAYYIELFNQYAVCLKQSNIVYHLQLKKEKKIRNYF